MAKVKRTGTSAVGMVMLTHILAGSAYIAPEEPHCWWRQSGCGPRRTGCRSAAIRTHQSVRAATTAPRVDQNVVQVKFEKACLFLPSRGYLHINMSTGKKSNNEKRKVCCFVFFRLCSSSPPVLLCDRRPRQLAA